MTKREQSPEARMDQMANMAAFNHPTASRRSRLMLQASVAGTAQSALQSLLLLEEIVFYPTKWRSRGPPHNPSIRRFVSPTLGASMRRNVDEIAGDDVDASPGCACCFP
jgi:hypothetical protein